MQKRHFKNDAFELTIFLKMPITKGLKGFFKCCFFAAAIPKKTLLFELFMALVKG